MSIESGTDFAEKQNEQMMINQAFNQSNENIDHKRENYAAQGMNGEDVYNKLMQDRENRQQLMEALE